MIVSKRQTIFKRTPGTSFIEENMQLIAKHVYEKYQKFDLWILDHSVQILLFHCLDQKCFRSKKEFFRKSDFSNQMKYIIFQTRCRNFLQFTSQFFLYTLLLFVLYKYINEHCLYYKWNNFLRQIIKYSLVFFS